MKRVILVASIVNVIVACYFIGGLVGKGLVAWHMAYYDRNGYPKVVHHYTSVPRIEGTFSMYASF